MEMATLTMTVTPHLKYYLEKMGTRGLFVGTTAADVQVFLQAHNERNLAEYEGRVEIDEELLANLIQSTKTIEAAVARLDPPARN